MQSFAKVPHSAKLTSSPQRREAAPRSVLHAPQRLMRAACSCGGTCPHCRGEAKNAAMLQPKLTVNEPGDAFEQEADRVADQVMRMPDPNPPADPLPPAKPDSSLRLQRRATSPHGPATAPPVVHEVLRSPGQPLDAATRALMEPRFDHDFGNVRIHNGPQADRAAASVQARAFTLGRDVVFAAGEHDPASESGKRLLAHELTHVVQQSGSDGIHVGKTRGMTPNKARPDPVIRSSTPFIQRDEGPEHQHIAPAVAAPPQVGTAQDAIEFLQMQEHFLAQLRVAAQERLANIFPVPIHTAYAEHYRVHQMLSQDRVAEFLRAARSTYEFQSGRLPVNDPLRTTLRDAYVRVLHEIRLAMRAALNISNGLSETRVAQPERTKYAENLAAWIEASPITSAGLADSTVMQAADVATATSYEAEVEAYLDELLSSLPTMTLNQAQRDNIYNRIQVALRRAFLTVGAGASGTIDVRAISNPTIVAKYQRVITLLGTGVTPPASMDTITSTMPAYALPDPVPDVSAQFGARAVDLSHVPASELAAVRFGVLQAVNTILPGGIQLQNAFWPVVLQTRRGGAVVPVRYELVFDSTGGVRVERLGAAVAREVAPAFQQLAVPDKKTQLMADFGLAAVDDRPAAPPGRLAATWSGPELDQVKAAFDLIPARDRAALAGVTLVRDHQGPAPPGATVLTGFFHTGASAAHDQPGPPAHGVPHIHYYDAAFQSNAILSVGPAGATGPGGDWTLLHEVGHGRMAVANRAANTAITAANTLRNQRQTQLTAAISGLAVNAAQQQAWQGWNQAQLAANQAIVAFNQGLTATPPVATAQQAALLLAAQQAVQARDAARAGLAAAALPQGVINAATNLDAANDAMLAASQQLAAAQEQIPIFVALAGRFAFHRFTDYARTGGDDEWFAETYALYLSDPNRLLQMNRSLFLWFEAGMPMDRTWNPPAP